MEDLCQKIARVSKYSEEELEAMAAAPHPEETAKLMNTYAITISPPQRIGQEYARVVNKVYRYVQHKQIFHDDYRVIIGALRGSVNECKIYPEISDNGRLHYHGIVVVCDYVKWKKRGLTRLARLGFCKLKPQPNEKWLAYCKKEWEITKEVLEIEQPIHEGLLKKPLKPKNEILVQKNERNRNQQSIYTYFKIKDEY